MTVLVSPLPLYSANNNGLFSLGSPQRRLPIMVTLETTIDDSRSQAEADTGAEGVASRSGAPGAATSQALDPALLSPPVNTFKSKPSRPRHRPTRSQSAPPERRVSQEDLRKDYQREDIVQGKERRATTPPPLLKSVKFGSSLVRISGEPVRPPPPLCACL